MPLIQLWHCEVKPLITRADRNIKLDYCFSVRKKYLPQHKEYLSIGHEKRSLDTYSAYHALLSNFFENCEWFHFAYFLWEILQVTEKTIGVLEGSIECARKLGSSNFFISILLISYSTVSFIFEQNPVFWFKVSKRGVNFFLVQFMAFHFIRIDKILHKRRLKV